MPKVPKDRLGRTWDAFLRLSPGERRVFMDTLREWYLQRRIANVAARGGGNYPCAGLSPLRESVSAADLVPPAKPSLNDLSLPQGF